MDFHNDDTQSAGVETVPPVVVHASVARPILHTDDGPVPEDETLLFAASSGDREALANLYDRHASAMLGLGIRILGSSAEAEDLVHDVFLEAWQRAEQYQRAKASVRAWLLMRTRSRAIDRLRRRMATMDDPPEAASDSDFVPSEAHREREALTVGHLLTTLTPAQRQVIELSFFEGLSGREISYRHGIPLGTVKSRLAAALTSLRSTYHQSDRTAQAGRERGNGG